MLRHRASNPYRLASLAALTAIVVACGSTQPTASPIASHAPTPAPTLAPTPTTAPTPSQQPATPGPTSSPTPAPTETPAGAALLLEVTSEGGFIAPSAHLGALPTVVVDTAGDIYTADLNAINATLIPRVVVRDVGANGAAQILAAMRAAGLDSPSSDGGPGNPDAGVTVFTAEIDGLEIVDRVAGGGAPGPGHPGASPNPAVDLLNRLLDPTETWGAADVAPAAFTPTAYKIYAAPATAGAGATVDWPLTASLAGFGTPATPDFGVTGLRTGAVLGNDAESLTNALASSPSGTLVNSNGNAYQVWIRPLLPPELSQ